MAASRDRDIADLNNHLIELLKEFGGLREALGNTNGKIDTFIQQLAIQDKRGTELEVRVRKCENRQYWWSGITAAIGALVGYGGAHSALR
jgi:hypothetical protein